MSDNSEKKIELKIKSKLEQKKRKKTLDDGFKKNKVVNEVLDKITILQLHDLINSKIISYVNGVVKAGKESVVFWAKDFDDNDLALKIYLVTTSNFKRRSQYVMGDPRFTNVKKGTKNIVYLWARKEFQNISKCYDCGISVVKPRHVSKNILIMDFEGTDGKPEQTLLESEIDENDYRQSISLITDLYKKAKLVHGDFSEYNIFKTKNGLKIFDLGSAVDTIHPNTIEFLKRDINNITNFFVKRGLTVENPADILERIIK
jgi:RIO kinase 1|tara:strand:- start:2352 stop:3131 length:780 start_codon:yes stop_codon:yes gene_type:complete